MRNQAKYLFIYLCVVCFLVGSVINLAQAQQQEPATQPSTEQTETELSQAELDQILAPIALYPDTLLSHILVAATYPLEVVQIARWREANKQFDEQQALKAVEDKHWAPSIKALAPFNDLLQKLSHDLEWLQSLGSAFLFNEERVLTSIQGLRQKAYAQGNLQNNEYQQVAEDAGEIIIESVKKEVVYIPYYDTRAVYGNWWWHDYPPHYWHRPSHYLLHAGIYWSARYLIRPNFYFTGFHWHNRHVVASYEHRTNLGRHWSNGHSNRKTVRVTEYPRWQHNPQHRRGAHYKQNGKRIIRNSENPIRFVSKNPSRQNKTKHQIDRQRVLDPKSYGHEQRQKNKIFSREVTNRIKPLNKNNNYFKSPAKNNEQFRPSSKPKNYAKIHNVGPVKHRSVDKQYTPKNRTIKPQSYAQKPVKYRTYEKSSAFEHKRSKQSSYQRKPAGSSQRSNKSRPAREVQSQRRREKR